MFKRLNKTTVIAFLVLVLCSLSPSLAGASTIDNLCTGSGLQITSGSDSHACDSNNIGNPTDTANNLIKQIIDIISAVVGIIAVIIIIVSGFRYVTSGGGDETVKSAKNGIIYAVIGLIIVAIAQILVHFVISKTVQATQNCVGHHVQGGPNDGQSC